MSNEVEQNTARNNVIQQSLRSKRNQFFLSALFRPHHSTDTDAIISAIKTLQRDNKVKNDANLRTRLDRLLASQRDIARIEKDYARTEVDIKKNEAAISQDPRIKAQNLQSQTSRVKRLNQLRQRNQIFLLEYYHQLPDNSTRNTLISLLGITPEILAQHQATAKPSQAALDFTSHAKLIMLDEKPARSYGDLVKLIAPWLDQIENDNLFRDSFLEAFKLNAKIASIVKENIEVHKDKIKKLISEKKRLANRNMKEAKMLDKKMRKSPDVIHVFSNKFETESLRINQINKEIRSIEIAGAHNLLSQLNSYLQSKPLLQAGWRELQAIKQELPKGPIKQALHLLTAPTVAGNEAEAALSAALIEMRRCLQTPPATKLNPAVSSAPHIPHSHITSTLLEEKDQPDKHQVTVGQTKARETNLQLGLIRRVWMTLTSFYHRITGTKASTLSTQRSSVTTDVEEDATAPLPPKQDNNTSNRWLHDNFPSTTASWASRFAKRFSSFLGLGKPQASTISSSSASQLALERDLLIRADQLIRAQTKTPAHHIEMVSAYLSQSRELIKAFAQIHNPSTAHIAALNKLKEFERTLTKQKAQLTQPVSSSAPASSTNTIQPPRPK